MATSASASSHLLPPPNPTPSEVFYSSSDRCLHRNQRETKRAKQGIKIWRKRGEVGKGTMYHRPHTLLCHYPGKGEGAVSNKDAS